MIMHLLYVVYFLKIVCYLFNIYLFFVCCIFVDKIFYRELIYLFRSYYLALTGGRDGR